MLVENHKEEAPFAHYAQRFPGLEPADAVARLGVKWDGAEFYVNLLGREYAISHPDYALRMPEGGAVPPLPVQTFLLRWLLEGKNDLFLGRWKTFRELPWGDLYQQPFSGRVLSRAAFTFGTRMDAFRAACKKLGAMPVDHGEAGFEFVLTGNYRMRLLLWEGDEEFPPSAQVLYSDNFASGFTAEDRVVAADILINTIRANM